MAARGIKPKKYKVHAKTGHKGISTMRGKFTACIAFPRQINRGNGRSGLYETKPFKYHIGVYDTMDEAIAARLRFISDYIL